MSFSPTQSLSNSNSFSGNGNFIPLIDRNDSRRTIWTRIRSLQVTATTHLQPAKYRPMNVPATILLRVIIHLPEGPFFENASIDEVSMPSGIAIASTLLRTDNMSQLPLYWWAADTLMEVCVPYLLSTGSTDLTVSSKTLCCIGWPPIRLVA